MTTPDEQMEEIIGRFFEENFEALQMEGGHSLAPDVREVAWLQVLLYWRKLRAIAERVTNTEVELNLPDQRTPKGRRFSIEGVVDIVRENDRTVMYDIKTHDPTSIRGNLAEYEKQLNIYAHIWQNLRNQSLDETAVICTAFPNTLREAIASQNQARMNYEMDKWDPLIQIPFNTRHLEEMVEEFGRVVDKIEEGEFAPPPAERLRGRYTGSKRMFATDVCRNCDARFSCSSYRAYAAAVEPGVERGFFQQYDDFGTDTEQDTWILSALDAASEPDTLE